MLWLGYCYTPSTVSRNPRTRLICMFTLAYIERLTVFNSSELIITFKIKTCLRCLVKIVQKTFLSDPIGFENIKMFRVVRPHCPVMLNNSAHKASAICAMTFYSFNKPKLLRSVTVLSLPSCLTNLLHLLGFRHSLVKWHVLHVGRGLLGLRNFICTFRITVIKDVIVINCIIVLQQNRSNELQYLGIFCEIVTCTQVQRNCSFTGDKFKTAEQPVVANNVLCFLRRNFVKTAVKELKNSTLSRYCQRTAFK